jgi:hypothetical protein
MRCYVGSRIEAGRASYAWVDGLTAQPPSPRALSLTLVLSRHIWSTMQYFTGSRIVLHIRSSIEYVIKEYHRRYHIDVLCVAMWDLALKRGGRPTAEVFDHGWEERLRLSDPLFPLETSALRASHPCVARSPRTN